MPGPARHASGYARNMTASPTRLPTDGQRGPATRSAAPVVLGCGPAPVDVLAHLAGRRYPVMARYLDTTLVAADPVEVAVGDAAWEVLRAPGDRSAVGPAGGWMGLLGYAAAPGMPARAPADGVAAPAMLCRYLTVVQFTRDGTCTVWGPGRAARRLAEDLVEVIRAPGGDAPPAPVRPCSSLEGPAYRAAVAEIAERVRAGDFSQVNLVQRLTATWTGGPLAFARRLWAAAGPSAYRAYFGTPEGVLVSASPERLLRVRGRQASSCPIKGTAPAGAAAHLAASAKDRAEHVMIVDLVRNDLGRVGRLGTVRVPALMRPLATGYVEHLESEICAELADGVSSGDALAAVFPAGSITGCPKVAAMRAIAELEPVARGPAFGSMVAVGPGGDLDASVLIRTAWLSGTTVQYWSGGAVTWDSAPEAEHREAMAKARPFLEALGCP